MKTMVKASMRRPAILVTAVFLAILGAAIGVAVGTQQGATPDALVGKSAPTFTLQNLEGKNISLSSFKGKVVVLDFWATWCPPCRQEIPHFIELQSKYSKRPFTFIGVSVDQDGPGVVRDFAMKNGMNYPQLMGTSGVVNDYGNFDGIPTTFVIDKKGTIRNMFQGYRPKEVFESEIAKLLAEK